MKEMQLEAVDSTQEFENVHGAIVTRSFTYGKRTARPGYCWFVYDINGKHHYEKKYESFVTAGIKVKPLSYKQRFRKIQGAMEIELSFVKSHGEANVKAMIIVNILNKKKFFK